MLHKCNYGRIICTEEKVIKSKLFYIILNSKLVNQVNEKIMI